VDASGGETNRVNLEKKRLEGNISEKTIAKKKKTGTPEGKGAKREKLSFRHQRREEKKMGKWQGLKDWIVKAKKNGEKGLTRENGRKKKLVFRNPR